MESPTFRFKQYMMKAHDIEIDENVIVWEAVTFYHEELDEQLVPVTELNGFPDPLTICCAEYDDENGDQWLFGIAIEDQSEKWLLGWVVKNGEILHRNIPLTDE